MIKKMSRENNRTERERGREAIVLSFRKTSLSPELFVISLACEIRIWHTLLLHYAFVWTHSDIEILLMPFHTLCQTCAPCWNPLRHRHPFQDFAPKRGKRRACAETWSHISGVASILLASQNWWEDSQCDLLSYIHHPITLMASWCLTEYLDFLSGFLFLCRVDSKLFWVPPFERRTKLD